MQRILASPFDEGDPVLRGQAQRIRWFILLLVACDLPLIALGTADLIRSGSAISLVLSLVALLYYGVYALLLRRGYGVAGTYGCLAILTLFATVAIHITGGFLSVGNALYILLLTASIMVLREERPLDFTAIIGVLSYVGLCAYETFVEPPPVFSSIYRPLDWPPVAAQVTLTMISFFGTWLLIRFGMRSVSIAARLQDAARNEAQQRAQENAILVAQAQVNNDMLLESEQRLQATIEALTVPLIPLADDVVLLPLVGYLDEKRAARLVDDLLNNLQTSRAALVVIDITGLREINAQAAVGLVNATSAVRLLGAEVVLTGLSPEVAQTLVTLEVNVRQLRAVATLEDAMLLARKMRREAAQEELQALDGARNGHVSRS